MKLLFFVLLPPWFFIWFVAAQFWLKFTFAHKGKWWAFPAWMTGCVCWGFMGFAGLRIIGWLALGTDIPAWP